MKATSEAPLVTLGVPTFNRPRGLSRCIEALLAQTLKNIEVVVSDNGSTDPDVRVVLDRYADRDSRLRVLYQATNRGPTANFCAVLASARGRYFMWCADDDWLEAVSVERLVAVIAEDPLISLASPAAITHQASGSVGTAEVTELAGAPFRRVLTYYLTVGNNSVFYGLGRTEDFRRASLTNRLGGDWMFVAQLAYTGRVTTVTQAALHRASGGTSRSIGDICGVLGLPWQVALFSNVAIAAGAASDICAGRGAFGGLRRFERWLFGVLCFVLLYGRLFVQRVIAARVIWMMKAVFGEERYRKAREAIRLSRAR